MEELRQEQKAARSKLLGIWGGLAAVHPVKHAHIQTSYIVSQLEKEEQR